MASSQNIRQHLLKILFVFLSSHVFLLTSFAQATPFAAEHPVYLPDSINESHFEYSGLAAWRDKILLIPQHVYDTGNYHITAIDTTAIDAVLQQKQNFITAAATIRFGNSLSPVYNAIKAAILPRKDFGGFEAAVVVGDFIFLTVETDSLCYVVKGTIDADSMQVNFRVNDTLSLPKPDYQFSNAGYESIAWLPDQKRLIAMYENNAIHAKATAYTFTTNLGRKEEVTFGKPMLFRLTDITHVAGNVLWGINHYYRQYNPLENCDSLLANGQNIKTEYCYYIRGRQDEATREMGADPRQTSYTRIVQLTVQHQQVHWKEKVAISYSNDNWEGIIPYKKGVLMIVDGRPPGVPCKLSYFEIN